MKPIDFTIAIKKLSLCYSKNFDEETTKLWYEYFKDINKDIFNNCIDKIIKENKFLPSVADILKECDEQKGQTRYNILEVMNNDGYFRSLTEYEKAVRWIEKDNIPHWFIEDMKKYYNKYLENKNIKLIGD